MAGRRGADSLRRRSATRSRKSRVLICCEGKVTEPEYFQGLVRSLRAVPVEVTRCDVKGLGCDPSKVVLEAEVRLRRDRRKNGADAYDQVWCVVDHDSHPSLAAAVEHARKAGINLVRSVPCFDYWLLLHYADHRKESTPAQVVRELRKHIKRYNKHVPETFPFDRHADAEARAIASAPDHVACNLVGPNPSTNVWLVVRAVQAAGRRR
jgi:RloB-like protein